MNDGAVADSRADLTVRIERQLLYILVSREDRTSRHDAYPRAAETFSLSKWVMMATHTIAHTRLRIRIGGYHNISL